MGSSKGSLYSDLSGKMRSATKKLWEAGSGEKKKIWFTEAMDAEDYDSFLEQFLPGPHQDNWDSYSWWETPFIKKEVEERAISLMDSLHRDLYNLYKEDEINSMAYQRNSDGKWLAMAGEIEEFTKE